MNTKHLHYLFNLACILALVLGVGWWQTNPAQAASFVVNDNIDDANAHDKNPGNGICASWYNTCTLRAAIEEANAFSGADTITFATPMTIHLNSTEGRMDINTQVRLDASGVWDSPNNRPGVNISGVNQSISCLHIYGINVEVYGLSIYNCYSAIGVYAAYNTIGGTLQGQRNVLSGNAFNGIYLGNSGTHHNVVQGNWIGLSITGDSKVPNESGVVIMQGAHDNTIGGNTSDKGNYISGNTKYGILIEGVGSNSNKLGGNVIGLPAAGSQNVGNGLAGVFINSGPQNNQIGGSGLASNTIALNEMRGIHIRSANNNIIENNYINGNEADGVSILNGANNRIWVNNLGYNGNNGVSVDGASATGNTITANSIYENGLKGIELVNGGNSELPAPVITSASASGASGTGCAWCAIHIYSDLADQGVTYHGVTTANGSGVWTYNGNLDGPNITATNTGSCGQQRYVEEPAVTDITTIAGCSDTSEFSSPFSIANGPPYAPSNPGPASGATGVSLNPTLAWYGGDPDFDTVTYKVMGGIQGLPQWVQWCSTTSVSCAPGALQPNTTYEWQVIASDGINPEVAGPIWTFRTGSGGGGNYRIFMPMIRK